MASGRRRRASERPGSGSPSSDYITQEGFDRMRSECENLWRVERPEVTKAVSIAAALGDRSENADYIYGKKRLREVDSRIHYLRKRLDALTVVRAKPDRDDKIFFGAWVTLEDSEGGEQRYRLVGPDEADAGHFAISVDSPMGRALLGKNLDDEVEVRRPRGNAVYTVVAIVYRDPLEEGR